MTPERWQSIKELFEAVRAAPPVRRAEELERLCPGDPGLAAEVASLLEHSDRAETEQFLASASDSVIDASRRGILESGTRIGPYQVLKLLGRGGMGAVYLAQRVEDYEQNVAVKVIGTAMVASLLRRFHAERQHLAVLEHPNIVRLLDGGTASDGIPYLVMEYVDGQTLDEYCRRGERSLRERVSLLRQVTDAVAYAHEQGVLHRDLKPANVLVTAAGVPKVADFGLARPVQPLGDASATGHGIILGTPSYMAPEQDGSKWHAIGPPTDVHALGAMLYELLTGRPPFRGVTTLDTLDLVRTQDPLPPRLLQPQTPRDLETICLKCLAKDPARRYPTAAALGEELGRFLAGQPILARPVGNLEKLRRWTVRHPGTASLTASMVLLLTIGFVAAFIMVRREHNLRVMVERSEQREAARGEWLSYIHHIALADRALSGNMVDRSDELLSQCPPRLRGWEWHYLSRQRHGVRHVLSGHSRRVMFVAFSNDGRLLASSAWDRTVRLWDAATGHLLHTLRMDDEDKLTSVAFSPDGTRVAAACEDRTIRVWETTSGRVVVSVRAPGGKPLSLAYEPAGARIAAGGDDGIVRIWDAVRGLEVTALQKIAGESWNSVAYSPDGSRIAAAGHHGTVAIWDAATGRNLVTRRHPRQGRSCGVTFDTAGRCIAFMAVGLATVERFDPATGRSTLTLEGHSDAVVEVAMTLDGTRLASAGKDRSVKIWDGATGEELLTLLGHELPLQSLAFSPDGSRLASAGRDNIVRIWDATPLRPGGPAGPTCTSLAGHRASISRVAFSPDGRRIASASDDKTVKLWDVATGREALALIGHADHVQAVAFSPDGTQLATGGKDRRVRIWDAASGRPIRELTGHSARIWCVAYSPDGRYLASSEHDRAVKLWRTTDFENVLSLDRHTDEVLGVDFGPDGTRLAATQGNEVELWTIPGGRAYQTLKGHTAEVWSVAWGPDGTRIASGGADRTVRIWDAATGDEVRRLPGHNGTVGRVAFSPDGSCLASAGQDKCVRIWDVATGQERFILRGHRDIVQGVAFSPDGSQVASGSADGALILWTLVP